MNRISDKCAEITEEAERCMVMRPLNNKNDEINETWNRGWCSANDDQVGRWKFYNYSFVDKGQINHMNVTDFPVTYNSLLEMNKYFPIQSAGYIWLMPESHVLPDQVQSTSGYLTVHMGLIVPTDTIFMVSRSNYSYEKGTFIVFDENDIHESYNNSKSENCIILYVKALNK